MHKRPDRLEPNDSWFVFGSTKFCKRHAGVCLAMFSFDPKRFGYPFVECRSIEPDIEWAGSSARNYSRKGCSFWTELLLQVEDRSRSQKEPSSDGELRLLAWSFFSKSEVSGSEDYSVG